MVTKEETSRDDNQMRAHDVNMAAGFYSTGLRVINQGVQIIKTKKTYVYTIIAMMTDAKGRLPELEPRWELGI